MLDLEKKQRNFDKILTEEKLNGERISTERDNAERDAREKETKLLNLNRDLEDLQATLDESERSKRQLQVKQVFRYEHGSEIFLPFATSC